LRNFGWSYKDYLRFVTTNKKNPFVLKIAIVLLVIIFIAFGAVSGLYYFGQKALEPQRQRQAYINSTAQNLDQTKKSFEEILSILQVSGAKVETIDSLRESSKSADGFYASLEDYQKMLSVLETAKNTFGAQKENQNKAQIPAEYEDLKNETAAFYQDAQNYINFQIVKYTFAKELLLALGPDFYSQSLTKSSLWKENNEKEILDYYTKIKAGAANALVNLAKLSVGDEYKGLLKLETDYLQQVVKLSDGVINTLSVQNPNQPDAATALEASYQLLINAQKENEKVYLDLEKEKERLFNQGQNIPMLVKFVDSQDSLVGKFENLKKLNKIDENSFIDNILRGLQI